MLRDKLLISIILLLSWQIVFSKGNTLADYQSGFYVGAQGGLGWVDDGDDPGKFIDKVYIDSSTINRSKYVSKRNFGGSLLVGYSFVPYFSLEAIVFFYPGKKLGITSKGTTSYIEYSTWPSFNVVAKGTLPLEVISSSLAGWNIFGKAGPVLVANRSDQLIVQNPSKYNGYKYWLNKIEGEHVDWSVYLVYSLGVGYNFTDRFGIDLSYSSVPSFGKSKYEDTVNGYCLRAGVPSRNLITLGVSYKF